MDRKRLLELFELYFKGAASAADTEELMLLLKDLPDNEVMAILSNAWNRQDKNETFFGPGLREKLLSKLHLDEELNANIFPIETRGKSWFLKFAAAAAIVLALSMTIFLLTKRKSRMLFKKQKSHLLSMTFLPVEIKQF
jgi:hypothetical protein